MAVNVFLFFALSWLAGGPTVDYKNAEGFTVAISPVGTEVGHVESESKLDFFAPGGQRLCTLDYSSPDGEHGFKVTKAAWTTDGQYFVFSLGASGGHQPWHGRTFFYAVRSSAIIDLERYIGQIKGALITSGNFALSAPNTVVVKVGNSVVHSAKVSIRLLEVPTDGEGANKPLRCADGRVVEERTVTIE